MYAIELATRVPRKFRFPHFVRLCWFTARYYVTRLCVAIASESNTPQDLGTRVLDGLKQLSSFLIEQTTRFPKTADVSQERRRIARESVPWQYIKDPVALARHFRMLVLQARGESLDAMCFPAQETVKDEAKPVPAAPTVAAPVTAAITAPAVTPMRLLGSDAGTPKRSAARDSDFDIISRETPALVVREERQERLDPTQPELGTRQASVKTSQQSNRVVRRAVDEHGLVTVETRSVITMVERVTFD